GERAEREMLLHVVSLLVVAGSGSDHGDARRRAGIAVRGGDASEERGRCGGEDELDVLGCPKRGSEGVPDVLGCAEKKVRGDVRGERERKLEQKPGEKGRRENRPPAERARVQRQLEQLLKDEARRWHERKRPRGQRAYRT